MNSLYSRSYEQLKHTYLQIHKMHCPNNYTAICVKFSHKNQVFKTGDGESGFANYLSTHSIKSRCCLGHPSLSSRSPTRDTGVHMVIVHLHTGFLSSCLGYECLSTARSLQSSFEIFWTPPKPANAPNIQNHTKACMSPWCGHFRVLVCVLDWIGLGIVVSGQQLQITKPVISSIAIEIEMQKL